MRPRLFCALLALAPVAAQADVSPIEQYRGMAADEIELRQTYPDASEEEIAKRLAEWRKEQAVAAEAEREAAKNAPPPPTMMPIDSVMQFIPGPADGHAVRAAAPMLFQSTQSFLPQGNRLVEMYVTAEDVAAMKRGEAPPMKRQFQIQVPRAFEGKSMSASDFSDVSGMLEKELAKMDGEFEKRAQQLVAQGNASFAAENGPGVTASMDEMRFLGVHRREPWGLFYTMSMAGAIDSADGKEPFRTYGAGAVMRLGGQLVYLYSYADQMLPDAKTLAQSSLDAWANAVHAADPIKAPVVDEEARLRNRSLFGGLLGMAIIVVGAFLVRRVRNS